MILLNSLRSFSRFSSCLFGRVLGIFYIDNHVIRNRNSFISSFSKCLPFRPFSSFIETPTQRCFREVKANAIVCFLNLGVRHAVFKCKLGCRVFVDALFQVGGVPSISSFLRGLVCCCFFVLLCFLSQICCWSLSNSFPAFINMIM